MCFCIDKFAIWEKRDDIFNQHKQLLNSYELLTNQDRDGLNNDMYINHVILDANNRCRALNVNLINDTYMDMRIQSQRFPKIGVNSWLKNHAF